MDAYREQGVVFHCGENRLVGIVAVPEVVAEVGVLILVGGPQYRVGSHRQFTLLARHLAAAGFASLRFDYTGMGDSEGNAREFDQIEEDISAAIEALVERIPGVCRVVIWSLCDAASSAMMFAHRHARVTGMILLNPWVHLGTYSPEVKLAHYYRPLFWKRDQWRRLLFGEIRLIPAFRELLEDAWALLVKRILPPARQESKRTFIDDMLDGFLRFPHHTLIVLSEADLTAREFRILIAQDANWKAATSRPMVTLHVVGGADHTFSEPRWQEEVEQLTLSWVKRL